VELVTRNYWWPGVTREVERYVEGCDLCQWMKNKTEEVAGKLKLGEVLEKPWTHILVDFITKLPVVAGNDVILVVCDRLSKITHFIATMEGTSAEGLAREEGKGRKSNGICGETEKGTRESRSSIEKGTEGDEKIRR